MATHPRSKKRLVPMRVLSLGFCRSGTASMKAALEILLGHPCFHAFELIDHIDECEGWNAAMDAKFFGKGTPFTTTEQWDTILAPYAAVTDVPAICFADELLHAYPDAKVVLVERDIESWYQSFDDNVAQHVFGFVINLVALLDRWFLGRLASLHHRWARGWMGSTSREEMRACARDKYREHYAHVRRITPRERLLEYKLGSGWKPLCEFLGIKDVPGVPFPRVNESAAMEVRMKGLVMRGVRSVAWHFLLYCGPAASVCAIGWSLSRSGFLQS
ncbi:hypothetical protein Micbo1qcDRAFT_214327 [Microdochium bolleyi]|uniref:P-loop containing nucleoside triphosphate hydrolase protein n=1 Tax=Microdochium bolleyi TaxID=196109 RepID=A0A136IUB9_9PEZI|nr:hypothetical protein Micbo1qcDRAFT_214327 [Microdochium bolleyi]